ncbi:MAG: AMP-binding protein, partial [Anaerolineae bacterium]|nr:AMP-binding protein [Anaerolineae bacterium]
MVETTVEQLITTLHSRGVKLWIEEDQLRSRSPKGAITPALRDQVRDRKIEIIDFLRQAQDGVPQPSIQPVPRNGALPLSYAQQRLWLLDQLGSGAAYNIPLALKLDGQLDTAALKQTLTEIVRRHESLRTTFTMINDEARQVIGTSRPVSLNLIDLRHMLPEVQEAEVKRLAAEEALAPFDLSRDFMLRAKLLQLAAEQYVLLLTMHHSASDGWSLGILVREITALYESFAQGRPSALPELAIQYADFAVWQREWLQGKILEQQLAYWQDQLADAPQLLQLPTDRPRPPTQTFRGDLARFRIGAELTRQLQQLSRQSDSTLFMTLLTAFQILLMRYSGQEDIVVGSPIANRNRKEIEPLIGFFVNTLVLRTDLSGNPTFLELLAQVRQVSQAAYDHQDLPFERLVEALQPDRNLNHSPLVQIVFALQNAPLDAFELSGLRVSRLGAEVYRSRLDMELHLWEEAGELDGYCIYNPDLFEAATIDRMMGHFQMLLAGLAANPQQRIADLPLLTEAERHQILVEWNDTQANYPKDKCLHQLFEEQVKRTPDAIALIFEDQQITYRELNIRANQLAHYLRELGVDPEICVAILMEQSPEAIAAMLGVLKAGGAYVPLDPDYPPNRLAFTLQDTQSPIVLVQPWLQDRLPDYNAKVVCLSSDWEAIAEHHQENPESGVTPDNLAYIIYTSGSTGRPKGVMMPHRSLVLHFTWAESFYRWTAADRILHKISLGFDGSVLEIFAPLLCG